MTRILHSKTNRFDIARVNHAFICISRKTISQHFYKDVKLLWMFLITTHHILHHTRTCTYNMHRYAILMSINSRLRTIMCVLNHYYIYQLNNKLFHKSYEYLVCNVTHIYMLLLLLNRSNSVRFFFSQK